MSADRFPVCCDEARAQLAALHLRLFGEDVPADGDVVAETADLIRAALEAADGPTAWRVTLTAMFQDTRMVFY